MAVNNNTILAKAFLKGTNDFQQHVSPETISKLAAIEKRLTDPMNGNLINDFMDTLVTRIGFSIIRSKRWDNMLRAVFHGQGDVPGELRYGSTIQEIVPKWIKGHAYDDDVESLLKMHRPDAVVLYHSQNRKDQYPITVNYDELRSAFTEEYGLNKLVNGIIEQPYNADNYDEYRIMLQLLSFYEENWGFYKESVAAPTNTETCQNFLVAVRKYAAKLQFPSTLFNNVNVPVFAKPEELIFITTPEIDAQIGVKGYAYMFNVNEAEIPFKKVIVDEFPIPNALGLLVSRDFFVMSDTFYNMTNFVNPQRIDNTYYLNHWEICSVSPAVPAILFMESTGTVDTVITQAVTSLSATAEESTIKAGGSVQINLSLQGTVSGTGYGDIGVKPNSATYDISITRGQGDSAESVPINTATRVDEFGVFHLQKSGVEADDKIKIVCTSVYRNPSESDGQTYTATVDLTVAGDDE